MDAPGSIRFSFAISKLQTVKIQRRVTLALPLAGRSIMW